MDTKTEEPHLDTRWGRMASASPAPGALDSAEEMRMEIQRLTELLQQKDAAPRTPTSSSNSVDVVDREVP